MVRSTELAILPLPCRLQRPSRVYATVVDEHGTQGRRHFLAQLSEGSSVFPLAAPGVSFLLIEHGVPAAEPLLAAGPIDPEGIEAWYRALLSWPGLAHGDAEAVPIEAGEQRALARGAAVTARAVLWLQADKPALRYAAMDGSDAAMPLLVLSDQFSAETTDECVVRAVTSALLLAESTPAALGAPSAVLAARIAARLIEYDAVIERRADERLA
jgi:hypothetical protein